MAAKKVSSGSKLIMTNGAALFIGSIFDTTPHQHHAIQVAFGINRSFELHIENELIRSRAIMINSDIEHRLIGNEDQQVLLLVEPESRYGEMIKDVISSKDNILDYDSIFPEVFYRELKQYVSLVTIHIKDVLDLIFKYINHASVPVSEMDERIMSIIEYIEKNRHSDLTIKELANYASLSESRLQHLFKEQIGITIKRYLLWKKMMDGIKIIASNNDFTFSAHEAGFSDSSHISRTCKEMFGLTLSDLFKSSSSVQVFIED
ncbi:AraC family transcriptional regulator [Vallitalea okinawensis]|uniref:AraC family transcriptional regulator n=1 Tax=Vallitalea okinawensis TaxID=2078660 RepID=UPI000CFD83EC|nr:AraC family transcriptional regulator [Vallitalea okinawensis]